MSAFDTGTKKAHIETSKYWMFIFPALLLAVGLFGLVTLFSRSRLQSMSNSAFTQKMLRVPNLNLGKR